MTYLNDSNIRITAEKLYTKYGKPLEKKHWGQFVAISPTGKIVVARTLNDVSKKARERFGIGNYVFKIGEKAVGNWL